jgi:hypothetical protein
MHHIGLLVLYFDADFDTFYGINFLPIIYFGRCINLPSFVHMISRCCIYPGEIEIPFKFLGWLLINCVEALSYLHVL